MSELPKPNIELLDKALDFATRSFEDREAGGDGFVDVQIDGNGVIPFTWDQNNWVQGRKPETDEVVEGELFEGFCQTSCCIAGWGVIAAGEKIKFDPAAWGWTGAHSVVAPGTDYGIQISERAQDLFGLTDQERGDLFEGDNDLDTVADVINKIKSGWYRQYRTTFKGYFVEDSPVEYQPYEDDEDED